MCSFISLSLSFVWKRKSRQARSHNFMFKCTIESDIHCCFLFYTPIHHLALKMYPHSMCLCLISYHHSRVYFHSFSVIHSPCLFFIPFFYVILPSSFHQCIKTPLSFFLFSFIYYVTLSRSLYQFSILYFFSLFLPLINYA